MDDRITAILARLRGGIAGIYAQKKLDEFDEDNDTQDWDEFVKEFKTTFSDKSKAADAEWKIETFKQGKRNTADFMIEFKALATKADTDELHAIFLLKKNIRQDIIKTILGYPPIVKIVDSGLYSIFPFHFYFSFLFLFLLIFYF